MDDENRHISAAEIAELEAKRERAELSAWQAARSRPREELYSGLDRRVPTEGLLSDAPAPEPTLTAEDKATSRWSSLLTPEERASAEERERLRPSERLSQGLKL